MNPMKKYLFLLVSFLYTHFLLAQAPSIVWDKTIGGSMVAPEI